MSTSMNSCGYHVRSVLLSILMLICGINISYAANGDDWVLVERFEEQMKRAEAGSIQAMYEVGRMYERGRGTQKDMDQAIVWFEKAANQNNYAAIARLGLIYYDGSGVKRDLKKAKKYLQRAATASVPTAQFYLAKMYEYGDGVPQDTNKALRWYKEAAKGGYYQAEAKVAELTEEVAPPTKIASNKNQTTAKKSKKKVAKKKSKSRVNTGLMKVVMEGSWMRNNRAAGYLPSANTKCSEQKDQTVKCVSGAQIRNNGFEQITYVTEAILSGFNASDQFEVAYYNNVLQTRPMESTAGLDLEEEQGKVKSNIKLGKQSKEHHLSCELESKSKLVCTKDKMRTLTFNRFGDQVSTGQ